MVPKLPSKGETLTPDQVIAEVERCLESGKPFAYPGKQTKFGVMMRRLFPVSSGRRHTRLRVSRA